MNRRLNLIGMKFGRLTVLSFDKYKNHHHTWFCQCDCENKTIKSISGRCLLTGNTKSCGCIRREMTINKNTIHGLSKNNKLYVLWENIKTRCYNKNQRSYKDYGGRGIVMYEGWIHNAPIFIEYVSNLENCLVEGYSIDRINNNGNYEPGNLKWSTTGEQNRNQRNNKLNIEDVIEIRELAGNKTVKEIAKMFNISLSQCSRVINYKTWN